MNESKGKERTLRWSEHTKMNFELNIIPASPYGPKIKSLKFLMEKMAKLCKFIMTKINENK
jgi:hypothetical protein